MKFVYFPNELLKILYTIHKKVKKIRGNAFPLISKILIWKTVVFIFFEFSIMLFFYYFVTAFCEVYKKTQISWLADFFSSFLISLLTEIGISLLLTVLYITSINYKIRLIYNITIFFYNLWTGDKSEQILSYLLL